MAPIPIKRVVSVSSEDQLNPASNLQCGGSGRRWLTGPEEKARRAEVVLELSKKARINSLEISNFGSAFIEIHVSSSATDSPAAVDWLTLLPSCMLMTVSDSRSGNNKTSSVVCPLERFSATTASNKWSLFKVICRQPYNLSTQFGLQNIAFFSNPPTLTPSPSPSSHRHPSPSSHPPKDTPTPDHRHKIPSLPNSAAPSKPRDPNSSKTPQRRKRPLTEPNDKEEGEEDENEEFSGVESQSRLLRNALRGAPGVTNPILNKVAAERERAREKRFEESYEKKRLLVGELTKAAGKTDFAADYQKTPPSVEMAAAFRKISRHDNQCEIGQEKERPPWGVSRRSRKGGRGRGKGRKERGETEEEVWITKRRKKLSGMISECRRVLSEAGTAGGTSGQAETLAPSVEHLSPTKPNQLTSAGSEGGSDSDSDTTVTMDDPLPPSQPLQSPPADEAPPTLPCPLCGERFPLYAIELHAASCGEGPSDPLVPHIHID